MLGLVAKGAGIAMVRLGGAFLALGLTIVLTRALSPEQFGDYGLLITILALALVPVGYGWATLALRSAAEATGSGQWAQTRGLTRTGVWIACGVSLVFGLGIALYLWANHSPPGSAVLFGVSGGVILLFDQLSTLRAAVLRGLDRPALGQMPEMIVRPLVTVMVFAGLIWLARTPSVGLALLSLLSGSVAAYCVGHLSLQRTLPALSASRAKSDDLWTWIREAIPLTGGSGLLVANSYLDILLIAVFLTSSDVGYYKLATQIAMVSSMGYISLNMVAAQRFAAMRAAGSPTALERFAKTAARIACVTSLIGPLVIWVCGAPLVSQVFGAAYLASIAPLWPLFLMHTLSAMFGMPRMLLTMAGHQKQVLVLTALALGLNAIFCMLLIPKFGLTGAAWATCLAQTALNLGLWWQVRRIERIDTSITPLSAQQPPPRGQPD